MLAAYFGYAIARGIQSTINTSYETPRDYQFERMEAERIEQQNREKNHRLARWIAANEANAKCAQEESRQTAFFNRESGLGVILLSEIRNSLKRSKLPLTNENIYGYETLQAFTNECEKHAAKFEQHTLDMDAIEFFAANLASKNRVLPNDSLGQQITKLTAHR